MASEVRFYPTTSEEVEAAAKIAPKHRNFQCGACGNSVTGRVMAYARRHLDGAELSWCICSCEREEPTILIDQCGAMSQVPQACELRPDPKWPDDLRRLFEEASRAFTAGACTASAMASRKLLMTCACHEGDTDGKKFVEYVDYITGRVLNFPKARSAIDKIRKIGNEANHEIAFVSREDAKLALEIVSYMLNTIYSLPSA